MHVQINDALINVTGGPTQIVEKLRLYFVMKQTILYPLLDVTGR